MDRLYAPIAETVDLSQKALKPSAVLWENLIQDQDLEAPNPERSLELRFLGKHSIVS